MIWLFSQLLRQFLLTGLQQRTIGEQADRRGAEHFSGHQHPLMGDGRAALAHQLPGMQRCSDGKTGAETLGDRGFPADVAHIGGSRQDSIRRSPGGDFID